MPVMTGPEGLLLAFAGVDECVACTLPHGSGLELYEPYGRRSLVRLTLHAGAFGLGTTRPTGLAYCPERALIAVANRSGGVHLVAIRAGSDTLAARR
jgi:hypothetical protein